MTLPLPQENVSDVQNKCMQLVASPKTTIMELTKLLGKHSFTSQAVLQGRTQCRYLQRQQIQTVRETNSYQTKIKLSQLSLKELKWWKENLLFQNGKPLKIRVPMMLPKQVRGAVCQGTITGEAWSYQERTKHVNALDLIAVKLAITHSARLRPEDVLKTFSKNVSIWSYMQRQETHLQRDVLGKCSVRQFNHNP